MAGQVSLLNTVDTGHEDMIVSHFYDCSSPYCKQRHLGVTSRVRGEEALSRVRGEEALQGHLKGEG